MGGVAPERPTYSSEETVNVLTSVYVRLAMLEDRVADHDQRFDTLQTPFWKRWWFWLRGWPWYDLNAPRPAIRPWHRDWWR